MTASEIKFYYNLPNVEFHEFELTYHIYWEMDQPTDVQTVLAGLSDGSRNIAYAGMADFHNVNMINNPQLFIHPTWTYMTNVELAANGSATITVQRDENDVLNVVWTGQTTNMGFITDYELGSATNTVSPNKIFFVFDAFQHLEETIKPGLTLSTVGLDYIDFKAFSPTIPEPMTLGLLFAACGALTIRRFRRSV